MGKIFKWIGIAVVAFVVIGAIGSHGGKSSTASSSAAPTVATAVTGSPTTAPSKPKHTGPSYTVAQENAMQSARGYLGMGTGFSRAGLINQLSSKAGEGFPKTVATFAVNHLSVDWNKQAVLSAKGYLDMGTGFSRSSLINQLTSKAGEQFTMAQATYAAHHVGY